MWNSEKAGKTARASFLSLAVAILLGLAWLAPAGDAAAAEAGAGGVTGNKIVLDQGRSRVIGFAQRLKRVSVGDPKVVEVVVVSPREVLMNAKGPGATSVLIWDESGVVFTYEVSVQGAAKLADEVRERLAGILPKEKITVGQVGKGIVLSGFVSSEEAKETALKVAETVAPKKVVDNLQVDEVPQVLLKVHFAEISRSGAIAVGWGFIRNRHRQDDIGFFPGSPGFSPTGPFLPPTSGLPGPDLTFSGVIDIFLANADRRSGIFIRALQEKGFLRTLAEPNLRVMSGKEGDFLVGGEVPIPVPGQDGQVTILFRPFGIRLKFKPKVRKSGLIEMSVEPEVSSVDSSLAVSVQGFSIPGFKKSNTKTQVVLRDGQTMAISGLLSEERKKNIGQLPFIGDVPILGELFKSRDFQQDRTELIVLVTPEIIRTKRVAEARKFRAGFAVGRTPGVPEAPAAGGGRR